MILRIFSDGLSGKVFCGFESWSFEPPKSKGAWKRDSRDTVYVRW